jgi:hypothetical protein
MGCYVPQIYPRRKGGQGAWSRRVQFPTIGSAGRTVQIVLVPVILQKIPRTLEKATVVRPPLLYNFTKTSTTFLKINPQSNLPG